MFIREIITKFPNDNKKQLALAFISKVAPKFQNDSRLIDFQVLDIGEGKSLTLQNIIEKRILKKPINGYSHYLLK